MCVTAVVAAATSVVSFMSAQADYDQRAAQWQQNYTNALASGRDEQNQLQVRMIQEQDANSQRQQLNKIEGAEIAAEAEVSAANAGVSGISLDNILAGINRKVGMKQVADETNHMNTVAQITREMEATNTNIENRINSVQRPSSPSPLGYALQGIGGAMDAYSKTK